MEGKSFIEVQFPISKLSKESYKERKANYSQTLTGLGKWWGRKPLVLVRATVLGLLMPATDDPARDREIFLKILTMDDHGLRQRKNKTIPIKELCARLTPRERTEWFKEHGSDGVPKYRKGIKTEEKQRLQSLVFSRFSYDEKLAFCCRPEQTEGPPEEGWNHINEHLGTIARNIAELVRELGQRRFGHVPRVGDSFCGGGSIPFEAARIGCNVYAPAEDEREVDGRSRSLFPEGRGAG
jgi:adenine-specific DNA methylase